MTRAFSVSVAFLDRTVKLVAFDNSFILFYQDFIRPNIRDTLEHFVQCLPHIWDRQWLETKLCGHCSLWRWSSNKWNWLALPSWQLIMGQTQTDMTRSLSLYRQHLFLFYILLVVVLLFSSRECTEDDLDCEVDNLRSADQGEPGEQAHSAPHCCQHVHWLGGPVLDCPVIVWLHIKLNDNIAQVWFWLIFCQ